MFKIIITLKSEYKSFETCSFCLVIQILFQIMSLGKVLWIFAADYTLSNFWVVSWFSCFTMNFHSSMTGINDSIIVIFGIILVLETNGFLAGWACKRGEKWVSQIINNSWGQLPTTRCIPHHVHVFGYPMKNSIPLSSESGIYH